MSSLFKNIRKRYKIRREKPELWHFDNLGFGYIQIPKVATRSIRAGLLNTQGISIDPNNFEAFEARFGKHLPHATIRETGKHCLIFAFVRNPFARLYSAYADKILNASKEGRRNIFECHAIHYAMDFETFARRVCQLQDHQLDRHLRSQSWFLHDEKGQIPQFVGKLETFNADWDKLREMIPALGSVGRLNTAAGDSNYMENYSPELQALVAKRFAADFAHFGYSPD